MHCRNTYTARTPHVHIYTLYSYTEHTVYEHQWLITLSSPYSVCVCAAGRGYLEDRRPSSNSDPYLVCEALVRTGVLDDWTDFDWTNTPSQS